VGTGRLAGSAPGTLLGPEGSGRLAGFFDRVGVPGWGCLLVRDRSFGEPFAAVRPLWRVGGGG
jgi:hypothetical protein